MHKTPLFALGAIASLALVGCSSNGPMTTGDRLTQRGGAIADYGTDWSQGEDAVEQGRKSVAKSSIRIADGEKDLERARRQVAAAQEQINAARTAQINGERQIEDGRAAMERAEAAYSATKSGPSALPPGN